MLTHQLSAQKNVLTFGVQYKPIFPFPLLNTRDLEIQVDEPVFNHRIEQKFGNSFGMVVRRGLTDLISLESGINFIQRNYNLDYAVADSNDFATNDLRIVSYEIPLSAMVYIRLGEEWFLNTSLGVSAVMFPSNVGTNVVTEGRTASFQTEGLRRSWFQGAMIANVGVEYRTRKKGYFYLGSSFHLPFQSMYYVVGVYNKNQIKYRGYDELRGSFLTIDLRYFFNEKPQTAAQRKQSKKKTDD